MADPAADGLIQGRMDWHRPVFFVNAATHIGLRHASVIAERVGRIDEAKRWEGTADRLEAAWRAAFADEAYDEARHNDRTAIAGLWVGEVAEPASFERLLEDRWIATHGSASAKFRARPLWTYFTVAETHQWLRLRRPDRVWSTLDWLWAHQPAPGLYTLWEGDKEENSFGVWKHTRGWVKPRGVTPHYWSAAEMLLLQLAMLAELEGPPRSGVLVIGSGVPKAWLAKPFSVGGVGTAAGPVAWSWDGEQVTVRTQSKLTVRLGPAFPPAARVRVDRRP